MEQVPGFSHLHVHSEYSILDGIIRIEELIKWTEEYGKGYVALTDHGNLYGALHLYTNAVSAGLKPIIGIEAYVSPTSRMDKKQSSEESNNHLILYAADYTGYKNLVKLASLGYTEGFHYKPRIDTELLRAYNEGIIVTTACMQSRVYQLLLGRNYEDARKYFEELLDIFGRDRLFIEYMNHGIPEQIRLKPHIKKLSEDYNIPVIATNDAHYVNQKDAKYQDIMMCVQMNKKIYETNRLRFFNDQFYLKTWDEMLQVVDGNAEWLANCDILANLCDLKIDLGEFHFPTFKTPDNSSPGEYLGKISREGLRKRFHGGDVPQEYSERLDYELKWINELGYAPYFLIIEDFVRFALERKISKGPGRGSGAGSLVSYAVGITDIDPIKYKLLFERFINPARKSMPDMDIDFDPARREEVIDYVREKYGKDRVCQIVTFNRLKARAAVRDSGRVLDIPLPQVDEVSKMIPFGFDLESAMEITEELQKLYRQNELVREWLDTAIAIEGLIRTGGVHPAGIVIADKPIVEYAPVMISEKTGDMVAQYSMKDIEKIGLIKMDFLGLRTLTYMEHAIELVRQNHGIEIDPEAIPLNDKATYRLLCDTDTLGVFQLESSGMRSLMREVRPDHIGDLIAVIALFRPGPIRHAPQYAERKHKKEKIQYAHPKMKPILDETYGVITYQEQITMILVELGGMSLPDAVNIIKFISKKRRKDEIEPYRGQFTKGTSEQGINPKIANEIFDSILDFAGYGFNKSHSAAYGLLAYWTAYLKANYPVEFYAAFLTSEMANTEKITEILAELRHKNIPIYPPDINKSLGGFAVEGKGVRFGLVAIKGLGEQAVDAIIREREKNGAFKDLVDFTTRVDLHYLNRGAMENLIKSSAMDCLPANRAQKIQALDRSIEIGKKKQEDESKGQVQLFDLVSLSQNDRVMAFDAINDFPDEQKLRMEKELTGFYLSGHPLLPFQKKIQEHITFAVNQLEGLADGEEVIIGGLISSIKYQISKTKLERYAIMRVEDLTGSIEVMVFPSYLRDYGEELEEEAVVLIKAKVRVDIRETVDENGETIENRQAKLILDAAKRMKKPSEKVAIVPEKKKSKPRPTAIQTEIENIYTEIDSSATESSKIAIILPMPENILSFGEKLGEILTANPGDTEIIVKFLVGAQELAVELGEDFRCDAESIKKIISDEIANVKFNYF